VQELPASVTAYKRTAEFDESSVPAGLLRSHSTAAGVWGRICVLEGELRYRELEPERRETVLRPGRDGIVAPQQRHEVEPQGAVRFYVEFLR
jgi:tellurite resistance-related uncharacterized protein